MTKSTIGANSIAVEMSDTTAVSLIPPLVDGREALISLNMRTPTTRTMLAVTSWIKLPAWSLRLVSDPATAERIVGSVIPMDGGKSDTHING